MEHSPPHSLSSSSSRLKLSSRPSGSSSSASSWGWLGSSSDCSAVTLGQRDITSGVACAFWGQKTRSPQGSMRECGRGVTALPSPLLMYKLSSQASKMERLQGTLRENIFQSSQKERGTRTPPPRRRAGAPCPCTLPVLPQLCIPLGSHVSAQESLAGPGSTGGFTQHTCRACHSRQGPVTVWGVSQKCHTVIPSCG